MTGTNCDLFTHNQSRSYLNHLVHPLNGWNGLNIWEEPEQIKIAFMKKLRAG
jgi:hypothetical protein